MQLTLQNQIQTLEASTRESVGQLWNNDSELRDGNRASEFNLRTHQKVLNAMSLELRHLFEMHNQVVVALNKILLPEGTDEEDKLLKAGFGSILKVHDVELVAEDGADTRVVQRINWPHYHVQVEEDLKILSEHEEVEQAAQAAKAAAIVLAIDSLRKVCSSESLLDLSERVEKGEQILKDSDGQEFELDDLTREAVAKRFRLGPLAAEAPKEVEEAVEESAAQVEENDPEEVEKAAQELLEETRVVAEEAGKMMRGESYDQEVIDKAQAVIDADIAEHGDTDLLVPQAKEEAQDDPEPPPKESEFPDGADIFGG